MLTWATKGYLDISKHKLQRLQNFNNRTMTFQINFKSYLKYYNPTADISAKQLAVDSILDQTNILIDFS